MAKTKDDGTEAPAKKGKGKVVKIVVAGLLLAGGGAGAGVYASGLMSGATEVEDPRRPKLVVRGEHPAEAAPEGDAETKGPPRRVGTVAVGSDTAKVDPKKYEIAYYPIEQAFTANLADGGGFAQIGISVATYYDSRVGDNVARQLIPIRSAVLMVLSDQQGPVLSTPEGKQMLQRQLTETINGVLRDKEGFGGIENVYFTSFVVQ